jgi:hypothetical protein
MTRDKATYWIATGIVCAVMVFRAINFNLENPVGPMKGSPSIAHFSSGDPLLFVIDPLLFFGALVTSYAYFNKLNRHEHDRGRFTEAFDQRGDEVTTTHVIRGSA